jgi:CHAD domain-containing protein
VSAWPALALELQLSLDPAEVRPLLRRFSAARGRTLTLRWHDTEDAALDAQGLALTERRQARATLWRLEPLAPDRDIMWPCGTTPPAMQEAATRAALDGALPAVPLHVIAEFRGRVRELARPEPAKPRISLLQGTLHADAAARPVCRLLLEGSPPGVAAVAADLAQDLRLAVAATTLSAEAAALAGRKPRTAPLGTPELSPDLSVSDAFAFACAHLARVIVHYAPLAVARQGTEPVHQMRVALRRLRSALALFRRIVTCREFDAAKAGLRSLGHALGPARDWDVFATGTAEAVATAFPTDAAVTRLTAATTRRRDACYAALRHELEGPAFRRLGITLAVLAAARPWEAVPAAAVFGGNAPPDTLQDFAAHALSRRLRHLAAFGDDIAALPDPTLHSIRLRTKRLRYGVEMLAPLYPRREARRYLRRLAVLQERLGHLNDGAVAASLMAELGRAGGRGYAAGVVAGFVAAQARNSRARIGRSWRKFRRLHPFW